MARVSPQGLETPEIKLVRLTAKDLCFDEREVKQRPRPERDEISLLHQKGLKEFLEPERMGFVEAIDRVVGFEPHAMATVPAPMAIKQESWQLAQLELVSLLRHDQPVAYVSENLPNLEQLDQLPTRTLNEFEQSSLKELAGGEDIVTADEPAMIRMLGAVRASETCLACHSVPQKTLLGAFSYELRPVLVHESGTTAAK